MAIPSWLHLSQNSGNSGETIITITADTYSDLSARTNSIIVKSSSNTAVTKTVNITQQPREAKSISTSPSSISVASSGGTYSINIMSNGEWTATTIPSWISLSQISGSGNTTITVSVDTYTLSARTNDLIFSTIDNTATVEISQSATIPSLSLSPSTIIAPYTGGTYSLTINSNYYWSITVPDNITVSQNSGTGTTTISVYVGVNYFPSAVTETIVVTDSVNSQNCTVSQAAWGGSPYYHQYFTMNVSEGGKITFSRASGVHYSYYSIDGGSTWNDINSLSAVTAGEVIMIKSDGGIVSFRSGTNFTTAVFSVEGNIMSLFYADDFIGKVGAMSLNSFFKDITGLTSAENLILPSTSVTSSFYSYMFQGCTGLTKAPELPAIIVSATTLNDNGCYFGMFENCTSLRTAPDLPSTTLAGECYKRMFHNCTSLTSAPTLPATVLTSFSTASWTGGCYEEMFSGCISLRTMPTISATSVAQYSCKGMFRGCTSLTGLTSLLSTSVAKRCYEEMFSGCTSLSIVPSNYLPATSLEYECYCRMFDGCYDLTTAPELPATSLDYGSYTYMFRNCSSLTTAPELPATTLVTESYYGMFSGCSSLNYIKCLATDISASMCTGYWVEGVSSTGTFVKDSSMNNWTTGISGIPSGWIVQDA